MKILFHINSLGLGGAERVISILSAEFAKKEYEVVIATEWEAEQEYHLDSRVRRIHVGLTESDESKGRISKALLRFIRLRQAIQRENPDVVISFCFKENFRVCFGMIGMKKKLIVSVRNDPEKNYAPYRISTAFMERKASGCVFQTPDAKSFFSEKLQKKSRIILNPLDDSYASLPERKVLPPGPSVTETGREKVIVNVGRISEQKNQKLLLETFLQVHKKYPEYLLKIYGDVQSADVADELHKFVSDNQLTDAVIFCGSSKQLQKDIRNAAVFVLSSAYEGMPNALIEAMVLGLPCVSTDCPCGGSKMLIEDGENGLLVPNGDSKAMSDAVLKLIEDPYKAEKMGNQAALLYERVNAAGISEQWLEFINKKLR